jgi:hypothetical protein
MATGCTIASLAGPENISSSLTTRDHASTGSLEETNPGGDTMKPIGDRLKGIVSKRMLQVRIRTGCRVDNLVLGIVDARLENSLLLDPIR